MQQTLKVITEIPKQPLKYFRTVKETSGTSISSQINLFKLKILMCAIVLSNQFVWNNKEHRNPLYGSTVIKA